MITFGDYKLILDIFVYNNSGNLTPADRKKMECEIKECNNKIAEFKANLAKVNADKKALESSEALKQLDAEIAAEGKKITQAKKRVDNATCEADKDAASKELREIQKAKASLSKKKTAALAETVKAAKLLSNEIASQKKSIVAIKIKYIGKVISKIDHLIALFTKWQDLFLELSKVCKIYASGDSWFACEKLMEAVAKCGITYIGAVKSNRIISKDGKNISLKERAHILKADELTEVSFEAKKTKKDETPADSAKIVNGTESTEGANGAEIVNGVESTEDANSAKIVNGTESTEGANSAEIVNGAEVVKIGSNAELSAKISTVAKAFAAKGIKAISIAEQNDSWHPPDSEPDSDDDFVEDEREEDAEGFWSGKEPKKYQVFRYEGKLSGIEKAVVLVCWKSGKFHKAPARAFVCMDFKLTTKEIIAIYAKRWQIETFFQQAKMLGLGGIEVRALEGLQGCLHLLAMLHTFCAIGLDKPMSLSEGKRWLNIQAKRIQLEMTIDAVNKKKTKDEIWSMLYPAKMA
jgi:hypothetical protein